MPRCARRKSATDVYHVMLRGINRQDIFADEEDYRKFLNVLKECKKVSDFEIYAFCLMPNHVHLLIKTGEEPLDLIFKRIGSRYVYWYNLKYDRVGHLFQDRYKSEAVEDERYFLTVLRYIIQNPMKAGLEETPGSYPFSSIFGYKGENDKITDVEFARKLFRNDEDLLEFLCEKNDHVGMEYGESRCGLTDEEAKAIMTRITGCRSVAEFRGLDKSIRKKSAAKFRENHMSLGQIARITGMSKATIYRATK